MRLLEALTIIIIMFSHLVSFELAYFISSWLFIIDLDYSASELGCQSTFNFMTALIELFAAIGWAYDLKRAPKHVIQNRRQRTGDSGQPDSGRRRHPFVDWILGLTLSASALWILIALRITNQYFCFI